MGQTVDVVSLLKVQTINAFENALDRLIRGHQANISSILNSICFIENAAYISDPYKIANILVDLSDANAIAQLNSYNEDLVIESYVTNIILDLGYDITYTEDVYKTVITQTKPKVVHALVFNKDTKQWDKINKEHYSLTSTKNDDLTYTTQIEIKTTLIVPNGGRIKFTIEG